MFVRDDRASRRGTSLVGIIEIAPAILRNILGEPMESEGVKTTGEYTFVSERGEAVTLYDYKATSRYSPEAPTPEEFWDSDMTEEMHIGAQNAKVAVAFAFWLGSRPAIADAIFEEFPDIDGE